MMNNTQRMRGEGVERGEEGSFGLLRSKYN